MFVDMDYSPEIPGTRNTAGKSQNHNFQLTGVWDINFAKGWYTFSGFMGFWRESRPWMGTEYIFMSEPQFWVNLKRIKGWEEVNLSIGGEVELSNNFIEKGFRVMPSVGAEWTF